ncbi:MAG: calcium/sodium antiporter [Roseibium sp.]|nr:calcium/sodium antiporter [Roseibium sp.]
MAAMQILVGLIFLGVGGDALVRGAVGAAERLKISPLVTGLVLVGFGTSTPELVTSLSAVLQGSSGIAIGNVIGSNIANILLILGLTAAITPICAEPRAFKRDAPMLAIATGACVVFALNGEFGRLTGVVFLAILLAYVGFTYVKERGEFDRQAKLHVEATELVAVRPRALWLSTLIAAGGVALVIFGANWMVSGSISIARTLGVSETVIGLTIVAIGTSLPELATSVIAALRKQTDIAFGNIIGSNIFNTLGIIGVAAAVAPITVPPKVLTYDLWLLVAVTALLLYFAFTEARLSRREGAVFLVLYTAYLGFLALRATSAL